MANIFDQFDEEQPEQVPANVFDQFDPGAEQPPSQDFAFGDEPVTGRGAILPVARTEEGGITPAVPEFALPAAQAIRDLMTGKRQASDISGEEVGSIGAVFGGVGGARTLTNMVNAGRAPALTPTGQAAANLGVNLPRAVGSEGAIAPRVAKTLADTPIVGTPLLKGAQQATDELGGVAQRIGESLGQGSTPVAGGRARAAIKTNVSEVIKSKIDQKFTAAEEWIVPTRRRPLTNTAKVAAEITARRGKAFLDDSDAVKIVQRAIDEPKGLTYEGAKNLRTTIGELLDSPNNIPAGVKIGELKQIFGSLTDDLRNIVIHATDKEGRGLRAFEEAVKFTKRQSTTRKELNKLLGENLSDEAVMDRIIRMAGKTSTANIKLLGKVRGAVDNETWSEIGSALIARIGKDASGEFVPSKFLTEIGRLSPAGKKLIFGRKGNQKVLQDLNDISKIASKASRLKGLAEPSQRQVTAGSLIGIGGGIGTFSGAIEPLTAATAAIGANIMARTLARPEGVSAMANYARFLDRFKLKGTGRALFENAARVLAIQAANDAGDPSQAKAFEQQLLQAGNT